MSLNWFHLLAFGLGLLIVLSSIPQVKTTALRLGFVDRPGTRKLHDQPMVRLGGLSICLGTVLAISLVGQLGGFRDLSPEQSRQIGWLMLGGLGFFGLGLLDDLINLSPFLRLAVQISIASLVWWAGIRVEFLTVPGLGLVVLNQLSLPLTVLWITGVVNAINWIDGLDGLASGVAAIVGLVTFVISLTMHQPGAALVIAALIGSLLGFLYYNFNPAQIFMGDGGSYFIGFMLAGVSILGLTKSATVLAIFLPLLILAVPLFDMSTVILTRLQRGKSPFNADNNHLHHRLLRAGLSHRLTVLTIYAMTLWAGSLAIAVVGLPVGWIIWASATGLLGCSSWKIWQAMRS